MKKLFHYAFLFAAAGLLTTGFTACSDDDDDNNGNNQTQQEQQISNIINTYVDNVIYPTYTEMATHATTFYNNMKTLRDAVVAGNATDAQVSAACDSWKLARACYEKSEAFLLGAASDYDIDPHIDTWPLDLTQLQNFLTSPNMLAQATTDDDDANIDWVHNNLNQTQLGFHSVEFVIFRNGNPRPASEMNQTNENYTDATQGIDITSVKNSDELNFAVAVAGDLMYSIYELEVCWNPNAPAAHKQVLEDLEWHTSMPSSDITYGENMKNSGKVGSTYGTVLAAASAILAGDQGCSGICTEVGDQKMGNPYGLDGRTPDVHYIESPYAHNSLTDFWDNIQSIKNTWYGKYTADNNTDGAAYSFHAIFANGNSQAQTLGKAVEDAITDAQAKIRAIPEPFVQNYSNAAVGTAIEACTTLSNALIAANNYLQSQQ